MNEINLEDYKMIDNIVNTITEYIKSEEWKSGKKVDVKDLLDKKEKKMKTDKKLNKRTYKKKEK